MLNPSTLNPDRAMLLVIDFQTKLLPEIDGVGPMLGAARQLLQGCNVFDLPMLATVQYAKGLGGTHASIDTLLNEYGVETFDKAFFSSCGEEEVRARLRKIDRPQVILCGIETHICVMQTTLDLLSMDYQVWVCADAVGSRRAGDRERALNRLMNAGAIISTVESALFEMCKRSNTDTFKKMLEVIKVREPVSL